MHGNFCRLAGLIKIVAVIKIQCLWRGRLGRIRARKIRWTKDKFRLEVCVQLSPFSSPFAVLKDRIKHWRLAGIYLRERG